MHHQYISSYQQVAVCLHIVCLKSTLCPLSKKLCGTNLKMASALLLSHEAWEHAAADLHAIGENVG